MRKVIKKLYLKLFSYLRQVKPGVYILNGHFLTRELDNEPIIFEILLAKMASKGIKFLNIEDAIQIIQNNEQHELSETYVAFTFDDGFFDCFNALAPALEKFGVNACFFVNPNFVNGDEHYLTEFVNDIVLTPNKKPMSWEQIRELKNRGFIIGNHTLDHKRLSMLNNPDAINQIKESKIIIERELGEVCEYFAWPYGQLTDINDEILRSTVKMHKYIFSGCDYKHYFSFNGKVFNRRHFEANWAYFELKYFLTFKRK
jgi:peptidoglycan/xylan/chitin deacetylase (PgdA/CDA1 family)